MDKYFDLEVNICRAVLTIFGLWPCSEGSVNLEIILRYTVLLVSTIGFCNIPQTAKLFDSIGNFDEMIEIITNCNITIMVAVMKTMNLWYNRRDLDILVSSMIEDWKVVKTRADKLIMQRNAKLSHLTSVIIFWVTQSAVLAFLVMNSYNRIKESQSFALAKVNSSERIRPLYMLSKFPYDVQKSPYYEITWICQFLSTLFGATAFAAIDAFFAAIIFHLCAQMKLLRERFKDLLAKTALKEEGCERLDLTPIIERHNYLIQFADTIENVFNVQLLLQLLSSLLIFCLTGYQIVLIVTKDVISVLEILFAAYYYMSFAGSLFVYCLISVILSTESTKMKETAYNSDWYRLSPSDVKLLTIIMIRADRLVQLTAGKFVPLSLNLYCSVLKTSGGYLSMLLAVKNRFRND